jgi:hypothetical protein
MGGGRDGNIRAIAYEAPYWSEVRRQTGALLKKKGIEMRRQWLGTIVRLASALFIIVLIAAINAAWVKMFSLMDSRVRDLPNPERQIVHGIPSCGETCTVFGFTPAPDDAWHPDEDLDFAKFVSKFPDVCPTTCGGADCGMENQTLPDTPTCSQCCELHRVHLVVRSIIKNNGTGSTGDRFPIASSQILGFKNTSTMTDYVWNHPAAVQVISSSSRIPQCLSHIFPGSFADNHVASLSSFQPRPSRAPFLISLSRALSRATTSSTAPTPRL